MAKIADQYFKLDPWKVIEKGFDPQYSEVAESIFSLGNEYMGMRGYFEEGGSVDSLVGSYFNGVYEFNELKDAQIYKGIINRSHFIVNSVNWLFTRIQINGEVLDLGKIAFQNFERSLDFQTGLLVRSFDWILADGKKVQVIFERLLDMTDVQYATQRISLLADFDGTASICIGADFDTIHGHEKANYWNELEKKSDEQSCYILSETKTTNQKVFSGFQYASEQLLEEKKIEREKFIGVELKLELRENGRTQLEKRITNVVDKNHQYASEALIKKGKELMNGTISFIRSLQKQKLFWQNVWQNYDIEIEGDLKNQQGIRYCIFQLQQTYHGQDPSNNIGAKGLTGEAYGGLAFWDTETCCLPYYLFTNLDAAKNLLLFRYNRLPQAKKRAKDLDCEGACYPVATINGDEASHLWQHASLQFQASTGVAYGIYHYCNLTKDHDFLYDEGIEMLIEVSRFLYSRGAWGQLSKKFSFYGVMGPDEFQMMVNHNAYTNYMAQRTMGFTLDVLDRMSKDDPSQLKKIIDRTNLNEDERQKWKKANENMLILQSKSGIYEQNQGFFDLPHLDINKIPVAEFPLYDHWSYDHIYRNDMIKQPDVLMFMFLYNQSFSKEIKQINFDYYASRTIHESSLSPAIHSILAQELGLDEEAYKLFEFATRMDLDNYNRNTKDGLHTTSIASAWMNIVYGFGGLRSDGPLLRLSPSIPKVWKSYRFSVQYRGEVIHIKVLDDSVELSTDSEKELELMLYDEKIVLSNQKIVKTHIYQEVG